MFSLKNNLTSWQTRKFNTEKISNWIDAYSLRLGFRSFNSPLPLVYSIKRPITCCKICTILCMIFKKHLLIEMLWRSLFTKYAHCKQLFLFQNNAWWIIPKFGICFYVSSVTLTEVLSNYGLIYCILIVPPGDINIELFSNKVFDSIPQNLIPKTCIVLYVL